MNKTYYQLEIEIRLLQQEDILTSSPNQFDDADDDIFAPQKSKIFN